MVHRAIGLVLRNARSRLKRRFDKRPHDSASTEHFDEAVADVVSRAGGSARGRSREAQSAPHLQVEYPVASAWEGGQLLSGYIDLSASTEGLFRVIDFKTDAPPTGPVEQTYPEYAAQVRAYGRLLDATGILGDRSLSCGLLFTADGGIRYTEPKGEKQLLSATGSQ